MDALFSLGFPVCVFKTELVLNLYVVTSGNDPIPILEAQDIVCCINTREIIQTWDESGLCRMPDGLAVDVCYVLMCIDDVW